MREQLLRLGLAGLLLVPAGVATACEKEDLGDAREGTRNLEKDLDEAEDKVDKEIGDNDKGKD